MHRPDSPRWYRRHAIVGLFAASAALLLFAMPYSNWDASVSGYYYDPVRAQFPLRNDILLRYWLHDVLRGILWLSPLAVILCMTACVRRQGWSPRSRQWLWLLCAQLAAPLVVSVLKMHTTPICPWDSLQFGGRLAEPAFAFVSANGAGHCFPAGHPSAGWGLIAYGYFWRARHPRLAWMALLLALMLGALMAWVQIARGAHLLSHVLWSLWVCWLVIWLLYRFAWPRDRIG
jgi:membrane-associated PAP2 superfamily phosphatase